MVKDDGKLGTKGAALSLYSAGASTGAGRSVTELTVPAGWPEEVSVDSFKRIGVTLRAVLTLAIRISAFRYLGSPGRPPSTRSLGESISNAVGEMAYKLTFRSVSESRDPCHHSISVTTRSPLPRGS